MNKRDQNPFKVPNGFFDDLPSQIQQRIAEANIVKPQFNLMHLVKHQIGVAFGVLFFIAIAYTGYRYNNYNEESIVQPDDYYEFVTTNSGSFSEQELIKVLNSDKKVASKKALKKESDKIIQYLVDQQVDIAIIEEIYNNQQNEID